MQKNLIQRMSTAIVLVVAFSIINIDIHAHTPHDEVDALGISPNFVNDRTLFLATNGPLTEFRYHDILRSTDGGATWTQLPKGMDNRTKFSAIRVSPGYSTDQTVFAATGNGIYKSSNRGNSWEPFNTGLFTTINTRKLEIAGSGTNYILFAGVSGGAIYRRSSTQAEWTKVLNQSVNINVIAASPNFSQDSTVMTANATGNLRISTDGGLTWTNKGNPTGATTYDIAIAAGGTEIFLATSNGIFYSSNSGNTFTNKPGNLPVETINNIALSPNYLADRTVFCTTQTQAVYKSTNRGNSWVLHKTGAAITGQTEPLNEFTELQVSQTFSSDGAVFLSAFDGLFVSTNGGSVWTQKQTREDLITGLAISPHFINDRRIMATTYYGGGFYTSANKGATWSLGIPGWPKISSLSAFEIDFIQNHAGSPVAVGTVTQRRLGFSSDFGNNWNILSIPQFPNIHAGDVYPTVFALSPTFDADQEIYLGSRAHGVLQTEDGGSNWRVVADVPHSKNITNVAISPNYANDKTVFAANRGGEVWRTKDGGNNWIRVGMSSILVKRPESYTWIAISPQFATDHLVLVGTSNGIYRSTDGGDSWNSVTHSSVGPSTVTQQIEFSPNFGEDRAVFVNVRGKGLYRLALSNTGAITSARNLSTSLLNENVQFTEFRISPSFDQDATLVGAGRRSVYISTDGGFTWVVAGSPGQ